MDIFSLINIPYNLQYCPYQWRRTPLSTSRRTRSCPRPASWLAPCPCTLARTCGSWSTLARGATCSLSRRCPRSRGRRGTSSGRKSKLWMPTSLLCNRKKYFTAFKGKTHMKKKFKTCLAWFLLQIIFFHVHFLCTFKCQMLNSGNIRKHTFSIHDSIFNCHGCKPNKYVQCSAFFPVSMVSVDVVFVFLHVRNFLPRLHQILWFLCHLRILRPLWWLVNPPGVLEFFLQYW